MDEAEIRRQVGLIAERLQAKDPEGLKKLYATDIVSFDIEPPLQSVGAAAKLGNWAPVFALFESVTYEVREPALTVGDDVAFGHAFARLSGTLKDGTAMDGMWVRVTYCFRKIDDAWLITHDHVSVPLDITNGKGMVDLVP
ncbi:nuclear transport factor 2 family protein (plasmid) [Embleya sp. NBC_00888]|uniref:YybH family protein n=1 Tax=Embleya sp. NBC_00888 TaxID=2975960 RepID=UPI003864E5F2|nr:nuclear transport factor 2 family protein [Embleya sp. NBC_00888]